jgi:hypothetical protein
MSQPDPEARAEHQNGEEEYGVSGVAMPLSTTLPR